MNYNEFKIEATVWLYQGKGAWHFVTVPESVSEDITNMFGEFKRGWGSLPVNVTVGETTWKTSIFPDKKLKGYLLPIKTDVRKKENINEGDKIKLLIKIIV
jgi:hypothetical protein